MRQFLIASRPLHDPVEEPPAIEGVRIRPYRIPQDEEAALRAYNSAFEDHWAHKHEKPGDWCHWMESAQIKPGLSWVAEPLDEPGGVVGFCICAVLSEPLGPCTSNGCPNACSEGWVDLLGIVPEWRGRGLGKSLLLHCLRSMRESGITYAVLGLDSGHKLRAAELYRSAGFVVPVLDFVQPVVLPA